jgi:SAM-dependent MidA family methyltransferase
MRFDAYTQRCLYEPGLGYYAGPLAKIGTAGDFVTAPEISPAFGAALARAIEPILRASSGDILELGPGQGTLAQQIIARLAGQINHYRCLELSADLADRQRAALARPDMPTTVEWLSALPDRIQGVVIANEVLDAVPVRLFRRNQSTVCERFVTLNTDCATENYAPLGPSPLAWVDLPVALDTSPYAAVIERWPDVDGYQSELNLAGEGLVASIAERLDDGIAIFIDYGYAARELYLPSRTAGTLMCHYRHRAHPDPLLLVGLQDITTHVDFTAMAGAAVAAGAAVLTFTTQAQFLLGAGLLDALQGLTPGSLDYLQATAALQRLVSPGGMGEVFKVLVIGRGKAAAAFASERMRMLPL